MSEDKPSDDLSSQQQSHNASSCIGPEQLDTNDGCVLERADASSHEPTPIQPPVADSTKESLKASKEELQYKQQVVDSLLDCSTTAVTQEELFDSVFKDVSSLSVTAGTLRPLQETMGGQLKHTGAPRLADDRQPRQAHPPTQIAELVHHETFRSPIIGAIALNDDPEVSGLRREVEELRRGKDNNGETPARLTFWNTKTYIGIFVVLLIVAGVGTEASFLSSNSRATLTPSSDAASAQKTSPSPSLVDCDAHLIDTDITNRHIN